MDGLMSKSKKRYSLLLEILLACTLLTLCAAPLIRKPMELYKRELQVLKDVEKERLADLSFTEVKLQLLKHEIPWKQLPTKETKKSVLPLSPALLQIPCHEAALMERRAIFRHMKEKLSTTGDIVRLLEIEIEFEPFHKPHTKRTTPRYRYQVIVKKSPS